MACTFLFNPFQVRPGDGKALPFDPTGQLCEEPKGREDAHGARAGHVCHGDVRAGEFRLGHSDAGEKGNFNLVILKYSSTV